MYLVERSTREVRGQLPPGRAGTVATIQIMRELVSEGAKDMTIRDAAVEIVRRAGVAGHDFAGEVRALFEFVRDRVRFTRDPVRVELLQRASTTLAKRAGDCDDKAILLASLLRAIGHVTAFRFRVVGADPRAPRIPSHVYLVARVAGRDVAMDPTYPGTPLGWQLPRAALLEDFAL